MRQAKNTSVRPALLAVAISSVSPCPAVETAHGGLCIEGQLIGSDGIGTVLLELQSMLLTIFLDPPSYPDSMAMTVPLMLTFAVLAGCGPSGLLVRTGGGDLLYAELAKPATQALRCSPWTGL